MRIFLARSGFQRHPVQRLLLGVGVIGVIAIAAIGAVLGLVLLTVGALAHFGLRALRSAATAAPGARNNAVLDGEYTVVSRAVVAPRQIPRAS